MPCCASTGDVAAAQPGKWRRHDERIVPGVIDVLRQDLHCRIGCGGATCKHEDWPTFVRRRGVAAAAIQGLNSQWVGDCVIASQRLSSCLFQPHDLIEQFNRHRVTGVFNLQEKGEHAYCGPQRGLHAHTGYSYDGETDLMRHGVAYYEFPWPDMTAPDHDIVLRSVQCMDSHMLSNKGRVLVHCHAGLGRTGLMIACYFMLARQMDAKAAIELVRAGRDGSIQTASQTKFCFEFRQHLNRLAYTFTRAVIPGGAQVPPLPWLEARDFMRRQAHLVHGAHSRTTYRYIPRPVHDLLCRVVDLAVAGGPAVAEKALIAFALGGRTSELAPKEQRILDAARAACNAGSRATAALSGAAASDVSEMVALTLAWFAELDVSFFGREAARRWLVHLQSGNASARPRVGAFDPVAVDMAAATPLERAVLLRDHIHAKTPGLPHAAYDNATGIWVLSNSAAADAAALDTLTADEKAAFDARVQQRLGALGCGVNASQVLPEDPEEDAPAQTHATMDTSQVFPQLVRPLHAQSSTPAKSAEPMSPLTVLFDLPPRAPRDVGVFGLDEHIHALPRYVRHTTGFLLSAVRILALVAGQRATSTPVPSIAGSELSNTKYTLAVMGVVDALLQARRGTPLRTQALQDLWGVDHENELCGRRVASTPPVEDAPLADADEAPPPTAITTVQIAASATPVLDDTTSTHCDDNAATVSVFRSVVPPREYEFGVVRDAHRRATALTPITDATTHDALTVLFAQWGAHLHAAYFDSAFVSRSSRVVRSIAGASEELLPLARIALSQMRGVVNTRLQLECPAA